MSRGCPRCRFLGYVLVTPGCWLWKGTFYSQLGTSTYGQFYMLGRRIGAHRASYLIHTGPIPDDLVVMHSCNTKACVNPAHLSVGTQSQNIRDGFAAHPGVCAGENHGRARLTWPIVRAIRAAYARGEFQRVLGERYGVSQVQISHIVRGERWIETAETLEAAS